MIRAIRAVAFAGMLLAPVYSLASAVEYDGGVEPESGSKSTAFTFWATGLEPGVALDINFVSPDGTVFSTAATRSVVVVEPDGSFKFPFRPTEVFRGESKGIWIAQACVTGTDDCDMAEFEIR